MKVNVIGNCQSDQVGLGLLIALRGVAEVSHCRWHEGFQDKAVLSSYLETCDLLLTNLNITRFDGCIGQDRILRIPDLSFGGYHPDTTILSLASQPETALFFWGSTQASALGFWAYRQNLNPVEAVQYFNAKVFERLGYFDFFDRCLEALRERFAGCGLEFGRILERMNGKECLWWGVNHPKLIISLLLVELVLEKVGIQPTLAPSSLVGLIFDPLEQEFAWGCYPALADKLGVEGSWAIRHYSNIYLTTTEYLTAFYEILNAHAKADLEIYHTDRKLFDMEAFDLAIGRL